VKHGHRFGLTQERIRIGQWLFVRYGAAFVFVARFLPFLRNITAALAGTNCMPKSSFYVASASAAATWVLGYGLAAYFLGEAFMNSASPVTISVGIVTSIIILIVLPATFARCEKSLRTKNRSALSRAVMQGPLVAARSVSVASPRLLALSKAWRRRLHSCALPTHSLTRRCAAS
jgi:hypothetical protein